MNGKFFNPEQAGYILGVSRDRIIDWDRTNTLAPTRRIGPQARRQYDIATLAAFSLKTWGVDVTVDQGSERPIITGRKSNPT